MGNKIRKTVVGLVILLLFQSCVKTLTPHQAASRGGLKCNRTRLK